jgi:hypothetical protein
MTQYVNYFPYGAGYEFSLDAGLRGRGTSETYRLIKDEGTRVVVEAALPDGIALRNEYVLHEEQLAIRHHVENRGGEAVTVTPVTHPEWDLWAFGEDAEVGLRQAGGAWEGFVLNAERRTGRDLAFEGETKPAGAWRLASPDLPFVLVERFDPEQVRQARLVLSQRGRSLTLQLAFKPLTIAPGETVTLSTTWAFEEG